MAKRSKAPKAAEIAREQPVERQKRSGIVHTSLYLPEPMHEGLREAAFKERRKIHDIVIEGVEMALRKRGWKS